MYIVCICGVSAQNLAQPLIFTHKCEVVLVPKPDQTWTIEVADHMNLFVTVYEGTGRCWGLFARNFCQVLYVLDINPPSFNSLSWSRLQWQQAKQTSPDVFLPCHVLQLFLGDPEVRPDGIWNPSDVFWVCPGVSSKLNVSRMRPQRGILITSSGSFQHKQASFLLWAPSGYLSSSALTQGEPWCPAKEIQYIDTQQI